MSLDSVPTQPTSSKRMGSVLVPWPKKALVRAIAPVVHYEVIIPACMIRCSDSYYLPDIENPSCLQTTCASTVPQKSSQTVPHSPFTQISTRPSSRLLPPTSLMLPLEQAIQGKQQ